MGINAFGGWIQFMNRASCIWIKMADHITI